MKVIDLASEGEARYRFEPIWFHRLLVEVHNENLAATSD
jgi:hypothetical protein